MSRLAVVPVVVVGLALPVLAGVLLAPLGAGSSPDLSLLEGLICGGVVLLAEVLGLRFFGGWLRRRRAAEWLAARNARLRAGVPVRSVP